MTSLIFSSAAFAKLDLKNVRLEPNLHKNPCKWLSAIGWVKKVDLSTDIATFSMSTVPGTRDTTVDFEIFNFEQDDYTLGVCMKNDAEVGFDTTNVCNGYNYSTVAQFVIPTPVPAYGYEYMNASWKIPGSQDTPACKVFYFEVSVDHNQDVTETNEVNNNTQKFCYHVDQGIIPIQPTSYNDCTPYLKQK